MLSSSHSADLTPKHNRRELIDCRPSSALDVVRMISDYISHTTTSTTTAVFCMPSAMVVEFGVLGACVCAASECLTGYSQYASSATMCSSKSKREIRDRLN